MYKKSSKYLIARLKAYDKKREELHQRVESRAEGWINALGELSVVNLKIMAIEDRMRNYKPNVGIDTYSIPKGTKLK